MVNFEKVKATMRWQGGNASIVFKEGPKVLNWDDLSRDEQIKVLNGLAGLYELFRRFLKED